LTLKTQTKKGKINTLDFIKIRNICFGKRPVVMKRQATDQEKILSNHMYKEPVYIYPVCVCIYIYKTNSENNNKKQRFQLGNGQETRHCQMLAACGEPNHSYTAGANARWFSHAGKVWQFLRKFHTPYDAATLQHASQRNEN